MLSLIYFVELYILRDNCWEALTIGGEGGRCAEKAGVQPMAHTYARAARIVISLDVK